MSKFLHRLREKALERIDDNLKSFRQQLASFDAIPQLALLGVVSGLVTGLVILLFRAAIEWPLFWLLDDPSGENFESLDPLFQMLLPLIGAVLIGIVLYSVVPAQRKCGVTYVMERLGYHQGYLSLRSAVIQFLCGVLTIASGQSAGREGPAIHLGAASTSLLGQRLSLPNNSIRMLVGCGCAAAISASFNTPIAGVIFAMEVVLLEYTINGFMPVILASVTAAVVTQTVYGNDPAFSVPAFQLYSLQELPYLIALAILIGILSSTFLKLISGVQRRVRLGLGWRLVLAGLITGLVAMSVPQVMGIGYDTVDGAIAGQYTFALLLILALAKLLVTGVAVGLGMPSGIIGPSLFIGAACGGALGVLAQSIMPTLASEPGFYAIMGMGAMMGAFLQAPLAAITAVIEFTRSADIMLPAMLVVISASNISAHFYRQKSVFLSLLQSQGMSYSAEPLSLALRRIGVGALMQRNFERAESRISVSKATEILKSGPRWIVIDGEEGPKALLPAADLARALEEMRNSEAAEPPSTPGIVTEQDEVKSEIDLMKIPAQRRDLASLTLQASLEEAWQKLAETGVQALYVQRTTAPMIKPIIGIVTRTDIENYYQIKARR